MFLVRATAYGEGYNYYYDQVSLRLYKRASTYRVDAKVEYGQHDWDWRSRSWYTTVISEDGASGRGRTPQEAIQDLERDRSSWGLHKDSSSLAKVYRRAVAQLSERIATLDLDDGTDAPFFRARHGTLPPNFRNWGLMNKAGETVAHVAAKHGTLPPGFDRWELADEDGRTVAEVVAKHRQPD